jgi:NTE family protein
LSFCIPHSAFRISGGGVRVVAVFGGGGAKAAAHIGAQRALVEAGLAPAHFVGTSFGAVIGAAFAAGATHGSLVANLADATRAKIAPLDPLSFLKGMYADHLIKPEPLRALIARLVPVQRFEDFSLPLSVVTTDLDSGALVVFGAGGRGDVGVQEALYATCALPLYYPPAVIGGRRYADGGLRAVLPLEPAALIPADLVVAVHVGPGFDEQPRPSSPVPRRLLPPLIRAHGDSERIMMAAQVERAIAAWPKTGAKLVLVRAVREREATFALEHVSRYVEAGYQLTRVALASARQGYSA